MKKYLVIGNPINHSLSPKLHKYWFKKNNVNADYDKKRLNKDDLKSLIFKIRNNEINGVNVTVPFKKEIIPHLDELTPEARGTTSVNTIYNKGDKIIGHNTDILGFETAIKDVKYNLFGKKVLILGAGGVVPSVIFALRKMKASKIILSNRTKSKAEDLKKLFNDLEVIDWGQVPVFDMIINATSLGLEPRDKIDLDFSKVEKGKFFYDIIYNPPQTNFLKTAQELGMITENGEKMFIHQAAEAFRIWHGSKPEINEELNKLLTT